MERLLALTVMTAAFTPAAVLGAMPLVLPVVIVLTTVLALMARVLGGRSGNRR
jgi:hypothetical protein